MKLSEKYSVKKIQPVDLFPHTHHIENVVLLEKEVGSGVGGEDSGTEKGPLAGT
jgi:hypothetical protein